MAEIIKVYKESLPDLRLIGKRYTDDNRGMEGSFGAKWGEFFEKDYFSILEGLGSLSENEGAYVGCMKCGNKFEYWIGMFFPKDTAVPEGFMFADIPKGVVGICWIYGREDNGDIYGTDAHNKCVAKLMEQGWKLKEDGWCFERYNCPRFTTPDEKGNVILDYGIYLDE